MRLQTLLGKAGKDRQENSGQPAGQSLGTKMAVIESNCGVTKQAAEKVPSETESVPQGLKPRYK